MENERCPHIVTRCASDKNFDFCGINDKPCLLLNSDSCEAWQEIQEERIMNDKEAMTLEQHYSPQPWEDICANCLAETYGWTDEECQYCQRNMKDAFLLGKKECAERHNRGCPQPKPNPHHILLSPRARICRRCRQDVRSLAVSDALRSAGLVPEEAQDE